MADPGRWWRNTRDYFHLKPYLVSRRILSDSSQLSVDSTPCGQQQPPSCHARGTTDCPENW